MSKPPYVYLPELFEYRAAAARRRAEAFCDAPEYVLGIRVRPLTPATFSMLLATKNNFVTGDQIREADVRNFIWYHSPLYRHTGVFGWRIRKWLALAWLTAMLRQPWRKAVGLRASAFRYQAVLALATADISAMVDEAFVDAPPPSGRLGNPVATTEAFFSFEFARSCNWAPERTRHTPLRQLVQLHRCIRAARGEEVSDAGEEKIWANHLRKRNEALKAERERLHKS